MAETPEARRARHERKKERMATDPEYAAEQRAKQQAAVERYQAKLISNTEEGAKLRESRKTTKYKFASKFQREKSGPVGKGKPGRIVSLLGWRGW